MIFLTVLETAHVVVGAAIATKIANPALAIPLAFASHFVLEKVPHWNPHLNMEKKKFGKITPRSTYIVIADVLTSALVILYFTSRVLPNTGHALTIFFASITSILPDVIEGPYYFWNMKSKFIERWIAFQKSIQADVNPLPGLVTQFLTIIAAFWWTLR